VYYRKHVFEAFTKIYFYSGISDEAIMELNLPTGVPFEYTLDKHIKPIGSKKFLGDMNAIKKAMDDVSNQGKKK